ncbi:MAG TPA: hypothetical protein PKC28_15990, partial [Bdellovibrionales bacterium]|nr:hypothetical protein [Bdellovibrionales bacterium]
GFLGAFPQPDPIAAHAAYSQGLFWWAHSFKVVKTVAEAKADDSKEKHNGSGKISYLISDVDVSDLPDGRVGNPADEENLKIIQARFREVIANTRMIYWDDSNQILGKDPSIPPMMFEIPREVWGPLLHPSTIGYYSKDHIGPRFNQSGWVFPRMRGEVTYKNVFESGSGTINKLLKAARSFVNKGGKIEFNRDFKTSLDHARDQWRFGEDKDGNKILVPGSSRYLAPDVYQKAVDAYKAGIAFSVEVRDPDGKLVAGSIGFRYHNVVSMDTIFYNIENNPEKGFPSRIDEAKFAVLAGTQRLNEAGINVIDGGMVTPFTAG